jgi:hypothetical protein
MIANGRTPGILLELLNSLNSCILSATARSSSRLGHGPLKAGARVRVPYALPFKKGVQGVRGVQEGRRVRQNSRERSQGSQKNRRFRPCCFPQVARLLNSTFFVLFAFFCGYTWFVCLDLGIVVYRALDRHSFCILVFNGQVYRAGASGLSPMDRVGRYGGYLAGF